MSDAALLLIDATSLFKLRGCEVAADVELPDGTLPTSAGYRITRDEWTRYREICAATLKQEGEP